MYSFTELLKVMISILYNSFQYKVSQDVGCSQNSPSNTRKQKQRSRTTPQPTMEEHLRGELMFVCGDCKAMVLHILASIKIRREQQATNSTPHESPRHHLHLNLNPVYH